MYIFSVGFSLRIAAFSLFVHFVFPSSSGAYSSRVCQSSSMEAFSIRGFLRLENWQNGAGWEYIHARAVLAGVSGF